jgi:hypothetical protein
MSKPDHISESLETIFWVKILVDTGSGMKKFGSRIRCQQQAVARVLLLRSPLHSHGLYHTISKEKIVIIVANLDQYVFGPPRFGPGSISTRYGSGSGSILLSSCKNSKKTLDSHCFVTSL